MLVRGRPGDVLPAKHDELTAVARLLGYKPIGQRGQVQLDRIALPPGTTHPHRP